MSSFFGTLFRVSTWGESHGGGVGVVVDGCPPRIPISEQEIQFELDRRKPGQSKITTQRKESDTVRILSGIQHGLTLGTPILMLAANEDARSKDYEELKEKYRPSHGKPPFGWGLTTSSRFGCLHTQCAEIGVGGG